MLECIFFVSAFFCALILPLYAYALHFSLQTSSVIQNMFWLFGLFFLQFLANSSASLVSCTLMGWLFQLSKFIPAPGPFPLMTHPFSLFKCYFYQRPPPTTLSKFTLGSPSYFFHCIFFPPCIFPL